MELNTGIYSSDILMEEIKWRIKAKYRNQTNFAKVFGSSRKAVSHILNHNGDFQSVIRMCKLLDIKGIQIE